MAYNKQTWQTGQVITADKLNHIQDGVSTINSDNVLRIYINNFDVVTANGDWTTLPSFKSSQITSFVENLFKKMPEVYMGTTSIVRCPLIKVHSNTDSKGEYTEYVFKHPLDTSTSILLRPERSEIFMTETDEVEVPGLDPLS